MAKLIVTMDGAFLDEYPLDKDRITIGRRHSNDIHIDNLAVSGKHAVVLTTDNDSFLEDLGSTNGTLVNSMPIKKHLLKHNDVIEFGSYKLTYINEAAAMAAPVNSDDDDDFGKTMIYQPPVANPASVPSAAAPKSDTKTPRVSTLAAMEEVIVGHLQVLNGPNMGKAVVLNKALTTLGKPGVQVAAIAKRPQGYFITHVEGQQHPKVNDQPVGAQAYSLSNHDVIELAGVKLEFYLAKAA